MLSDCWSDDLPVWFDWFDGLAVDLFEFMIVSFVSWIHMHDSLWLPGLLASDAPSLGVAMDGASE